jgi:AcrR family transcriptional regulator
MPDTEEKILDAALKILISEGYADATTRRIAQEANVTEMTLLQKFQSKENLFREARKKNPNEFLKYWDEAYKSVPLWDLDHPQTAFQVLINANEVIPGRVLDIEGVGGRKTL